MKTFLAIIGLLVLLPVLWILLPLLFAGATALFIAFGDVIIIAVVIVLIIRAIRKKKKD